MERIFIPTGTGNGIAMTLEGYDPVTAALSIIIGKLWFPYKWFVFFDFQFVSVYI